MKVTQTIAIAAAAIITAPVMGQNLLSNGSFETAGAGFDPFDAWGEFNNVFPDGPADASNEVTAQDGVRSMKAFGFFPGDGSQNDHGVFEEISGLSPNTEYTLSGYAQSLSSDAIEPFDPADTDGNGIRGSLILVVIDFKDAIGGTILGSGEVNLFPIGTANDTWNFEDVTVTSPAGTAAAQITVLYIQFDESPGSCFYDNISLTEGGSSGGPCNAADIDGDGDNDPDDIFLFVNTFIGGCP